MCSQKSPPPMFGPSGAELLRGAIGDVAERSFFAIADRCDPEPFAALLAAQSRWILATVWFEDGRCTGVVSCALPVDLVTAFFDSFSGRDPSDPPPDTHEVFDLVGEFANMVGGSWLTRVASQQTFGLAKPMVQLMPEEWTPKRSSESSVAMVINDWPVLVEASLGNVPAIA